MKMFFKFVAFIVGLAVIATALNVIIDVFYKSKLYFSPYEEDDDDFYGDFDYEELAE